MDWSAHRKHTLVVGRRLSYVDVGEGPDAVLLIHGLAASSEFWVDNFAQLSESRRIIAVDLPGFGDSDVAESYDVVDVARTLRLLCDELELGMIDIVGHSLGSLLASEIAAQEPERVRRLVFTGGPIISVVRLFRNPLSTLVRRPSVANFIVEALTASITIPKRLQRMIVRSRLLRWLALSPYVARPGSLRPEIAAMMVAGAGAPGVVPALRAGFRIQDDSPFDRSAHPTLVIAGRKDRIATVRDVEEFATHDSVKSVVFLDDCGHCAMFEQPELFNRALLEFLEAPEAGLQNAAQATPAA